MGADRELFDRVGFPTSELTHRSATRRTYKGIEIHAAPGIHEYTLKLCKEYLDPESPVLEIGSGSGALAERLIDNGFTVRLSDVEPPPNHPDMTSLDIAESSPSTGETNKWASILAVEVLEHLENPRRALRNVFCMLKPGGVAVLSTPNILHPLSKLKFCLGGSFFLFGEENYATTGHITPLPDWLLRQHLLAAGFNILSERRAGSFDYAGLKKVVSWVVNQLFAIARPASRTTVGDGLALFFVVQRPA